MQKYAASNDRRALTPEGRLVLNFFVPSFKVICGKYGEQETRTVAIEGDEYIVTNLIEIENEIERIVKERRTVECDGEVVREATYRLVLIPKNEFEFLLEMTDWSDWTGYGGFDREPLEDGAQEMVWIAQK